MKVHTLVRRLIVVAFLVGMVTSIGCASVPMASEEMDALGKQFSSPPSGKAGLYVYRDSFGGQALKKAVYIDSSMIGTTANKVYFYRVISPGSHTLSTESEFSDNSITFQANRGTNHFARQYIKMGLLSGGAGLEMVDEEEGKKAVLRCKRALD
jgi:Protein of unknown function (DUF2846)